MGRDLQKRKRRSSRPAVRQPSSAKSKRLLNPLGNNIIAQNWDKKATTTQNYRRLGLVSRLRAPTGGVEPQARSRPQTKPGDPFAIDRGSGAVVSEVRVERDANGRIVRVLDSYNSKSDDNPLGDPLNALDSDVEDGGGDGDAEERGGFEGEGEGEGADGKHKNGVVEQLLEEANWPRVKKPRTQSSREVEWLRGLVRRHGDDTAAMARDRVMNPMQQTEADIARRIRKWKSSSSD
ncbi:ribosome biogenesis protein Nop16 [Xylariaceae sp. FL0662B]|nr:ribosome biogenesis protein Nop16 [Xylariaceae sp. FL0662B]